MSKLPSSRGRDAESPPPIPIRRDQSVVGRGRELKDDDPDTPRHRFLAPAEWAILAHGIGGVRDAESHKPVHPSNWWWPAKGMPRGLYKDVVSRRATCFYLFHCTSILRWLLMILQLVIGATLTAIGSLSIRDGTPITVLGAANTVIAGLLALLHNSGLPDRYRHDMAEFEEVEDHIKELLDTGIAPADLAIDQILAGCFDLYQNAKATVASNMPVTYNPGTGRRQSVIVGSLRSVSKAPKRNTGEKASPADSN